MIRTILWPKLQPQRHTPQLPIIELPPRAIVPMIHLTPHIPRLQHRQNPLNLLIQPLPVLRARLRRQPHRHDHHLQLRHPRRDHQPLVVRMHQYHNANRACRETPAILPYVQRRLLLPLLRARVLHRYPEHLREVLA